jgi:hypothetical protein
MGRESIPSLVQTGHILIILVAWRLEVHQKETDKFEKRKRRASGRDNQLNFYLASDCYRHSIVTQLYWLCSFPDRSMLLVMTYARYLNNFITDRLQKGPLS